MSKVIQANFGGHQIQFRDDGWFNATVAAARFGKEPYLWLRQRETTEYVAALAEASGNSSFLEEFNKINNLDSSSAKSQRMMLDLCKRTGLVKSKAGGSEAGGGTWLHPKLAIAFARWLDVRFSIWCDMQIDALMRGSADWSSARAESKVEFQNVVEMLQECRALEGKETERHHYINESRLLRYAFTGDNSEKWSRDELSKDDLVLLRKVERLDIRLIGRNASYEERKDQCRALVLQHRAKLIGTAAA